MILLLLLFAAAPPDLEIRIAYDNTAEVRELAPDWDFAAVIERGARRILFDSGTKPELLLENLAELGIEPRGLEQAVLSHQHADHTNGISRVFPLNPQMTVHFLAGFAPPLFEQAARIGMEPRRESQPYELAPGMWSTGPVEGNPPEQALVVETAQGLVIVTGCSHPGVTKMVEAAERQRGQKRVRLLVGGFHMLQYSAAEIDATIARLKELNVESIVPTHCTGDGATAAFRRAFGAAYQSGGAGKRIALSQRAEAR